MAWTPRDDDALLVAQAEAARLYPTIPWEALGPVMQGSFLGSAREHLRAVTPVLVRLQCRGFDVPCWVDTHP